MPALDLNKITPGNMLAWAVKGMGIGEVGSGSPIPLEKLFTTDG